MSDRACLRVPEWLENRREARSSAAEEQLLHRHLPGCSACRRLAEETEPLTLFANLGRGQLPSGVEEYILGGLHVEEQHPQRWHPLATAIWRAPWQCCRVKTAERAGGWIAEPRRRSLRIGQLADVGCVTAGRTVAGFACVLGPKECFDSKLHL